LNDEKCADRREVATENSTISMKASVNTLRVTQSQLCNRIGSLKLFRQMISDKVVQNLNCCDLLSNLRYERQIRNSTNCSHKNHPPRLKSSLK